MSTIEQSVEVDVPVRTAYNQWTQFEQFSQFKEYVEARGAETGGWRGEVGQDPTR